MRVVLQRVSSASVTVGDGAPRRIGRGLAALVGFGPGDGEKEVEYLVAKTAELRIFEDENGNMNLSLLDVGGDLLVVPNFTLYANCKKGRRPSFAGSMPPDEASAFFGYYVDLIRERIARVETGEFGAHMLVDIQNDGPVTILLDTAEIMPKQS